MAAQMTSSPLLQHCYESLGGAQGSGHGVMYGETTFDSFEWLQTPGLWGQSPRENSYWQGSVLPPCGQRLLDAMSEIITQTTRFLDISSLELFPDGHFETMLTRSFADLARSGRKVDVRLLFGSHPYTTESPESLERLLVRLTSQIPAGTSTLRVWAGRLATSNQGLQSSFNHAKIIAADGVRALVGGHNLWSDDYFGFAPTNDTSASLGGPAAAEPHRYLDRLWAWIDSPTRPTPPAASATSIAWANGRLVRTPEAAPKAVLLPVQEGCYSALFLARFGSGLLPADQFGNLVVRCPGDAFRAARHSIFISHMDLAFHFQGQSYWPDHTIAGLADALTHPDRKIDVRIVLSEPGGVSGNGGIYSWGETLQAVVEKIRSLVADRPVTGTLGLAPIRISAEGDVWKDGERECKITNHSKLWMVDESLFYIGSDNLYPHNIQEFGYLIESPTLAAGVLQDYWNPLWSYSSRLAMSL